MGPRFQRALCDGVPYSPVAMSSWILSTASKALFELLKVFPVEEDFVLGVAHIAVVVEALHSVMVMYRSLPRVATSKVRALASPLAGSTTRLGFRNSTWWRDLKVACPEDRANPNLSCKRQVASSPWNSI